MTARKGCPICGPAMTEDGCCIRHGDTEYLWIAYDQGQRAMRERAALKCMDMENADAIYEQACRDCAFLIRVLPIEGE